jgi:hypothetical protein
MEKGGEDDSGGDTGTIFGSKEPAMQKGCTRGIRDMTSELLDTYLSQANRTETIKPSTTAGYQE